jgi:hypothetical protein
MKQEMLTEISERNLKIHYSVYKIVNSDVAPYPSVLFSELKRRFAWNLVSLCTKVVMTEFHRMYNNCGARRTPPRILMAPSSSLPGSYRCETSIPALYTNPWCNGWSQRQTSLLLKVLPGNFDFVWNQLKSRDSSVGIVTRLRTGRAGGRG